MDKGTGWLVTKAGYWVPVAYNASISETLTWRRASFTSLGGNRRVASRGRGPREWEVEEDVIYDWAQALVNLYHSSDADQPLYWIPPLAAVSNYAMTLKGGATMIIDGGNQALSEAGLIGDRDGVTGTQQSTTSGEAWYQVTQPFPLKQGVPHRFGVKVNPGAGTGVALRGLDVAGNYFGDLAKVEGKSGSSGDLNGVYDGKNARAVYGTLMVKATSVTNPYVALGHQLGVNHTGSGGTWVTLDDVDLDHKALSKYNPIVSAKFSLTECER